MSWFSRTGPSWGGRFSPFGRGAANSTNGQVSDSDFSYITKEDLDRHTNTSSSNPSSRHRSHSRPAAPEIVDWDDKNPDRDTDVLVFKHGRVSYPIHFPAMSIREGELKVGTIRAAAARKLEVGDPRRIRMFFKGRNLKVDERPAREEGLRGDGSGSEILVVVGDAGAGGLAPGWDEPVVNVNGASDDEDDDEEEGGEDESPSVTPGGKKPRKRGGKKNRKGRKNAASATASTTNLGYTTAGAGAEFLPTPSIPNPRPTSAPPTNPPPPSAPQGPLQKLDAIASNFHTTLVPMCITFINSPPGEKAKRDFEHKKLAETILAQVLLKLDGVETEGNEEARAIRKALVKETQGMLNKLDEVVKA